MEGTGESRSGGRPRPGALAGGIAALLAVGILAILTLLALAEGFTPCGLNGTCTASTSTRIEATGSLPLGLAATGFMLIAAAELLRIGVGYSAEVRRPRARRCLLVSGLAFAIWMAWLAVYPSEPNEPASAWEPPHCGPASVEPPEPGAVRSCASPGLTRVDAHSSMQRRDRSRGAPAQSVV